MNGLSWCTLSREQLGERRMMEVIQSEDLRYCPICLKLNRHVKGRLLKTNLGYGADCPRCPRATHLHDSIEEEIAEWNSRLEFDNQ